MLGEQTAFVLLISSTCPNYNRYMDCSGRSRLTKTLLVVTATISILSTAGRSGDRPLSRTEITGWILATYSTALPKLSDGVQKHFSLRMYRVTGDSAWLGPIATDAEAQITKLADDRDSISDEGYYRRRIDSLMSDFATDTRKSQTRHDLFFGHESLLLQLDWLYALATSDDYGLSDSLLGKLCREVSDRVKADEVASFLTDKATISAYSPQAANAIEYLRQLGYGDWRDTFRESFLRTFPDSRDQKLSDEEFGDKVYGLTHIVISASGYYQHSVDHQANRWALDYFERNSKRILTRLPADIIAEVGLCYLLCGDSTNQMIELCRRQVVKEFDKARGMVLSPSGSGDLESGEHRNILAWMLLNWSNRYYRGPKLDERALDLSRLRE